MALGPRALLTLALTSVIAGGTAPQAQAPAAAPPRDTGARGVEPTGTASIAGRVTLNDAAGRSLRRAIVRVTGLQVPAGRMTITDDEGHFVIGELPAGRFNLSVTKRGLVTAYYGSSRPGRGPGTPLSVGDGQHLSGIELSMLAGAVVTGRVIDHFGQPLPGARVTALERRRINGRDTLFPGGSSAVTDDRGEYRVFGLPPGEITISVAAPSGAGDSEARLTTAEQALWAQSGASPAAPPNGPAVTYGTVYYPGVADPSSAVMFAIAPGEERHGVDIQLQFVRTARVAGRVLTANGQPVVGPQVMLLPVSDAPMFATGPAMRRPSMSSNGEFTFPGVTPGRYLLTASASDREPELGARGEGAGFAEGAMAAMRARGPNLWARAEITVAEGDLTSLSLVLQPGITISGRIELEGGTVLPSPDLSRASVRLTPPPTTSAVVMMSGSGSVVRPDGTFTIDGVAPGRYLLSASVPGGTLARRWLAASALVKGVDALDIPIDVHPGENLSGVVVTLTDRSAGVTGRLLDSAGGPAPEFTLVLFSTDTRNWVRNNRRTRTARPASDGVFEITGMPAGTYHLAALTDLEDADLGDASLLEMLAAASIPVTLAEGETKMQDVRLRR
jgi:hypothetical protein